MAGLLLINGRAVLKPVLVMILTGVACSLTDRWIQKTTTRRRPCWRDPSIRLTTLPLDLYGFPSGHTLH